MNVLQLKMSIEYSLAAVAVLFVMISTLSSNVPLRSELGPQRPAWVYTTRLSTALPVPLSYLFQSESLLLTPLPPFPSTQPAGPSPP